MRVRISPAVNEAHPGLDDKLWNIAVHAKHADSDIKLMGLHVRVKKAVDETNWSGWAHPEEESIFYGTKLIHPAGRIDMTVGPMVSDVGIIRLFAHELRHIGQFHRGRKEYGYLTVEYLTDEEAEQDCYDFEDDILQAVRGCKAYRAQDFTARCHCIKR